MAKEVTGLKKWWVRQTRFEFWPFWKFYFPIFIYCAYLFTRYRSLFFFSNTNPSIEFGGWLGEKKSDVFSIIPEKYIPKTILLDPDITLASFQNKLEENHINYPFILKPDIGERGWMVAKVKNAEELKSYIQKIHVPFLLQEFIDFPVELGLFYVRVPGEEKGRVTSIVKKDFLKVNGDGKSSVLSLLKSDVRASLQVDFDSEKIKSIQDIIPKKGEILEIEAIGNHCRGTLFLNGNDWIDTELEESIDHLAKQIPDFFFGRFDLRCESIESLKKLKDFKILELNGAGSEPGHIYQPGYSLWQAYKDVFWHLNILAKIGAINKSKGIPYWSFSAGMKKIAEIRKYNRLKDRVG